MSRNRNRNKGKPSTMLQKADPNVQVVVAQQGVGTPAQMPRNMRAYIQEGYRSSKTVFRVVGHIARAGSGIHWKRYTDSSKKREITSPDDELMTLWKRPSPRVSGTMFREAMIAYYCMTGNSYVLGINAAQNPTAKYDELYNLRPDLIKIKVDDNGPLYYEFGTFTPPRRYPEAVIMHNKLFAGNDDIYGMSPVEVAAMLIDVQKAGQKWNLGLMNNMARPGGVWTTDAMLGAQEYKSLKDEIRKKFAGPRNAGETAILHGGVKWQSMSMSPYELDWLESDTKGDRDIAGIFFNFPTFLLGLADATFDNQDAAKRFLYTDIIFPILDMFEDSLNMWLTPRYGGYLGYDRDDVETIADQIKASKIQDSDRAGAEYLAGTTTFLEAREIQGKAKIAVKDFILIQEVPIALDRLNEYIEAMTEKAITPPTPPPPVLPADANTQITEEDNADNSKQLLLPPAQAVQDENGVYFHCQSCKAYFEANSRMNKALDANDVYQPDDLTEQLQALLAQGFTHIMWLCDASACDTCAKNDDQIRKIGEPFPSGHILPQAHPNCACDVKGFDLSTDKAFTTYVEAVPYDAISKEQYRELLRAKR